MLQIYNSLTRRKAPFQPLEPGTVSMYVCGITVYDYCHLGHARFLVVFDIVARYLRHLGYRVKYVRNITDIDDKIIRRAGENGEPIEHLTGRFIEAMHEDERALGVLPADEEPRATAHVEQMLALIQTLVDKDHAYQADNGDVCYRVASFPDYGKLANKNLDDLRAGARVEINEGKRDPLDFVLWKRAKPGEPSWPSPWGDGRPGWHIECSAMSTCCLGEQFDIHGGGMDLQFPHHENEIAQSRGAGHAFANIWMHNGFIQVDEEKMSKSLGNFFTIRQVLEHFQPEVVRYFLLASHYRSPLNYSQENLENARASLSRLYTALRGLAEAEAAATPSEFAGRFHQAMADDFNTPEALAALFDLAREINRQRDSAPQEAAQLGAELRQLGGLLGVLEQSPEAFLQAGSSLSDGEIQALIEERATARRHRDFARADQIRDELAAAGILLEDAAGNTTWRRG